MWQVPCTRTLQSGRSVDSPIHAHLVTLSPLGSPCLMDVATLVCEPHQKEHGMKWEQPGLYADHGLFIDGACRANPNGAAGRPLRSGRFVHGAGPCLPGRQPGLCDVQVAKMKTSRWSPPGEAARVRAPHEAIGPRPELILDCSNAWVGIAQASRYLSRTGQFNPGSSKNRAAPMTSKATHVRHTECALRRVPQGRPSAEFPSPHRPPDETGAAARGPAPDAGPRLQL
jgi:hypothetical protein